MNQPIASVRHGADQYGLRPEASEFPMMLVLSFVYPCNALCPHCPYTNSNIRKEYRDAPYMPELTFKRIADESGQYGAYLRISGGGEPMLHPQATELLVYAKNVGCKIGLITNGSLFDEANSRALLDAGVDMIEFSVDACDPQTYAIVRKGLEWDALVENANRMLSLRNTLKGTSKIVASAVVQTGIDINAVEKYWVDGIGIDYLIKRKFLTWGDNTTLDGSRSSDPAAYLNTDEVPCPFIFERLNIDSRSNVMVWLRYFGQYQHGQCQHRLDPQYLAWRRLPILSRQAPCRARQGHRALRRLSGLEISLVAAQLLEGREERRGRARAQAPLAGRARRPRCV